MTEPNNARNKILVAEDDPVSRRILQAFLAKWGYDVISVVDGTEAAKILAGDDAPRLAILDWMMPGIEGPQVCRRVRERTDRPYTYILLLTARMQKADIFEGLESGADDYLTKPFDAQELRARLHVGQRILDLQSSLIDAREALRFQATHDPLTGIWNHGEVVDAIQRESARQTRERGSFGIILLDLDHFKRVNDTYGHLAGDAVLRETARRIVHSVRPYDTVGRYGGEEFLIVAPTCDFESVMALAERIRHAIGSTPLRSDAGPIHITASCGVCLGGFDKPSESHHLVQKADEALYRAKRNGRNRSELADASELPQTNLPPRFRERLKSRSR
ncbi:MAG TPA: diguanylate cyclase [Candidatus Acidoferrales bacterium]|nr:diguanylate cyclase [Candidatus Acidoferrales bacterium]